MNLRTKILLPVALSLAALIGVLYLSASAVLVRSFADIERDITRDHLLRIRANLEDMSDELARHGADWAVWDDTFRFVTEGGQEFVASNVTATALKNIDVDVLLLYDTHGKAVLNAELKPDSERDAIMTSLLVNALPAGSPLLKHDGPGSLHKGLLRTPKGLIAVASRPVLRHTVTDGAVGGTLIFGRWLEADEVEWLAVRNRLERVEIRAAEDVGLSEAGAAAVRELRTRTPMVSEPMDERYVTGFMLLRDVAGEPTIVEQVVLKRTVYAEGVRSLRYTLALIVAVGAAAILMVSLLLELLVVRRLSGLARQVGAIDPARDPSVRLDVRGGDELSRVALGINSMLANLEAASESIRAYQDRLRKLSLESALAEERERRRIAADLHDNLGQALVLSKMQLAAVRAGAQGALARTLDDVSRLLDQTIHDTRTLTFDLSPPVLYDLGLGAAIAWLADWAQDQHGLFVELEDESQIAALDQSVAAIVFRAVRELVINVIKHAQVKDVKITLSMDAQLLRVDVEDKGRSFDTSEPPAQNLPGPVGAGAAGHFGLLSVKEQISRLGGRVEVISAPGHGTRVTLWVPPIRANEGSPPKLGRTP